MGMRASLRRLWRMPLVCLWILLGLLLAAWVACLRRAPPLWLDRHRQRLTRWWMRGLIHLLPLRIRRHGQAPVNTALWVGNHVSWLDIVVLGAQAPVHFLSKSEVRDWPVIGWLASAAGTLFIQRGQAAGQALSQLSAVLAEGHSLVIFAEGTTTAGDRVRTFHGRLLGSAVDTSLPVQPVALAYRVNGQPSRLAAFIDDDEFSRHLLRLLGAETIEVDIHFLPQLNAGELNRNQLARAAQAAVSQALGLRDETLRPVPSARDAA